MTVNQQLIDLFLPIVALAVLGNLCSIAVILLIATKIPLRKELWLPLAFLLGPLALLLFMIWAVYSGSMAHTMELSERHKIEKLLRQLSTRGKDVFDPVLEFGLDDYLEKLISAGRYPEALSYVHERLQIAHERDNARSERVYREYLARIEVALNAPLG